jgi:protein-tyrosine kinase
MERIREAIELAKAKSAAGGNQERRPRQTVSPSGFENSTVIGQLATALLSERHLESMRIVAHQPTNPMVPAFDILRTSVLQAMDENGWQTLVVSSPTPGCGKTVTAINLALSIARLPDRNVILIDLDMRRPLVSTYLGLKQEKGLLDGLSGEAPLADCLVQLNIAGPQLSVMANRGAIANPAEVMGSREMKSLIAQLRNDRRKPIIVLDTSPMLVCDDVLALLPQIDCLVLAIAERMSTAKDVEACERMLQSSNYLGLVLTKSHETTESYYY